MTFNDNADIGSGRVSRRGRNTAIGVGGGGIVGVVVLLVALLGGPNLTGLIGDGTGGGDPGTNEEVCANGTGADANENIDCRMKGAAASIDAYWTGVSPDLGITYSPTQIVLFDGGVETQCGQASSAVGPFYCPPDQTIYIDTAFFAELHDRFGANGGPLAEMYVVAHEWGHHIQNITGISSNLDLQDTGPTSDSVRLELQADCFAGAWAGSASTVPDASGTPFLKTFTDQDIADALSAASAVGDDRIQESTQGQVTPESWTHGSSEQRQKWFTTGLEQGPQGCNTFEVSGSDL
jgi:predicted metalloprotease